MAHYTSRSVVHTSNSVGRVNSAASLLGRRRRRARGQAGFSVVELIIVLTILMIISAIAIPNFQSAIVRARDARAVVEIHNISELVIGYAAGNNAQYPNSLADVDCDKLKDPWGNPYQYLKLTGLSSSLAREDRFHAKINTAFDLYSLGPDGLSTQSLNAPTSQDDVIYGSDGGYVGLAFLY